MRGPAPLFHGERIEMAMKMFGVCCPATRLIKIFPYGASAAIGANEETVAGLEYGCSSDVPSGRNVESDGLREHSAIRRHNKNRAQGHPLFCELIICCKKGNRVINGPVMSILRAFHIRTITGRNACATQQLANVVAQASQPVFGFFHILASERPTSTNESLVPHPPDTD